MINRAIVLVFILQIVAAIIAASFGFAWIQNNQTEIPKTTKDYEMLCHGLPEGKCIEAYYLEVDDEEALISFKTFFIILGTWILIFTNLVPISLLVTLEFVKFIQGTFMGWDFEMAHVTYEIDERGEEVPVDSIEMVAQSSNLNEELGQVEYIFSDKTGTLTQNVMNFKKFTAGTDSFGTDKDPVKPQLKNVSFNDPEFEETKILEAYEDPESALYLVMLNLALNHSVIIDRETGDYNAASPDEMALVNFAKQHKFEFRGEHEGITIVNINDVEVRFRKLAECEFTSTRKRASVVYEFLDENDETLKRILFTKGADSIIEELLSEESKESEEKQVAQVKVDAASEIGLRTLFLAYKELDDSFDDWLQAHNEALSSVVDRENKVTESCAIIE